jgi:hypothetical protein
MIRNIAAVEATHRLPASGPVLCSECRRPMVLDPASRALQCPMHGVLVAQIIRHHLWEGEIVEVLHRSQAEQARYVVRFPGHQRRTLWFGDLRVVAMRSLS